MLIVDKDGTIRLTRGDTARFTVDITDDVTKEDYEIQPTDILTMSIKKSLKDSEPLVQKIVTGTNMIHFLPEDTKKLAFGDYLYDVELNSSGDIYTIIVPTTFKITGEVT